MVWCGHLWFGCTMLQPIDATHPPCRIHFNDTDPLGQADFFQTSDFMSKKSCHMSQLPKTRLAPPFMSLPVAQESRGTFSRHGDHRIHQTPRTPGAIAGARPRGSPSSALRVRRTRRGGGHGGAGAVQAGTAREGEADAGGSGGVRTLLTDFLWLVVWNINFIFPFSWEFHHPN